MPILPLGRPFPVVPGWGRRSGDPRTMDRTAGRRDAHRRPRDGRLLVADPVSALVDDAELQNSGSQEPEQEQLAVAPAAGLSPDTSVAFNPFEPGFAEDPY